MHSAPWRFIFFLIIANPTLKAEISPSTFSNPGFQGIILAIANLNKAMRDASENPMDEWRRANVRRAMDIMPVAIRGLAAEYKGAKLNGVEFPAIKAMLGGFIDVNAGENYNKFLVNPDKRLIPSVGPGFPGGGAVASGEGMSPGANLSTGRTPVYRPKTPPDPLDSTTLGMKDSLSFLDSAVSSEQLANRSEARIGFNDGAPKGGLAPLPDSKTAEGITTPSVNSLQPLTTELSQLEVIREENASDSFESGPSDFRREQQKNAHKKRPQGLAGAGQRPSAPSGHY